MVIGGGGMIYAGAGAVVDRFILANTFPDTSLYYPISPANRLNLTT